MVNKGGGSGTPSYKKVVVDRGKGPRGGGFKAPLLGASGSVSETQGEDKHKKEKEGEENKENQSKATDPSHPNGVGGSNPCKPKMTMIPKVVLEDPQTQEYRDQMRVHALICKFMGLWPTEKIL
jgi:hypothetical protein